MRLRAQAASKYLNYVQAIMGHLLYLLMLTSHFINGFMREGHSLCDINII